MVFERAGAAVCSLLYVNGARLLGVLPAGAGASPSSKRPALLPSRQRHQQLCVVRQGERVPEACLLCSDTVVLCLLHSAISPAQENSVSSHLWPRLPRALLTTHHYHRHPPNTTSTRPAQRAQSTPPLNHHNRHPPVFSEWLSTYVHTVTLVIRG